MKLNGVEIKGINIVNIVIPRGNDDQIVFQAKAVLGYDDFDKLCPMPKAPKRMLPGRVMQDNVEDPKYKEAQQTYAEQRMAWMVLESLSATEGLEWETVKKDDPATWLNWNKELKASGFSEVECSRILSGVFEANALDENKIEAARQRFLALQAAKAARESGQVVEQPSTPSGDSANG